MVRTIHELTVRSAYLRIAVGAIVLSGISCRNDDIAGPPQPDVREVSATAAAAVPVPAFRQISTFERHTCAITPGSQAYCWGRNSSGQLGDGSTTMRLLPVAVGGGLSFRQISTGVSHTCGVTTGDVAYCWGNNGRGQLGDGTTTRRTMPTKVMGGLAFREITTGNRHTCGVTTANMVHCWGDNVSGQLGAGTIGGMQLMPQRIMGTLQIRQLSAGSQHTCGSTLDNGVFCWGLNNFGQLGDGTNTTRARAMPIQSDLAFMRVDAARLHTCAVTTDNRGYCWGDNSLDKLGVDNNGGFGDTRVPLAVMGGFSFRQMDGGSSHSCGLTSGNLAKCWGWGSSGQLGTGSTGNPFQPIRVAINPQFRQIATGFTHTCAVTMDDKAYCWGSNDEGELGVGTTLTHFIGTPVGGRPANSPFIVVWFRSEQNGSINPAVDTVLVGTRVTWIWSGGARHNVTSTGSPSFPSSAAMSGIGTQYAVTFNARGTYTYHCSFHENMTGRILVR